MSRYAKITEPLQATRADLDASPFGPHVRLLPGDEIKNVTIVGERYRFEARRKGATRVHFDWTVLYTAFDLPAFTDKGRAAREADRGVVRGRPKSKKPRVKFVTVRLSDEEYEWLKERAGKRTDINGIGTVARNLMVDGGLLK